MSDAADEPVRRRWRGAELEAALLGAAWDELTAVGYGALTMESVAARAHTGVAVLYRRWANKDALVLAAFEHFRLIHPVALPDTGNMREDLLGLLTAFSDARAPFVGVIATAAFSGLLGYTGLTPGQARARMLGEDYVPSDRVLFDRAHARGEIDLARIPADALNLPFDLVRHDVLMTFEPVPAQRIRAIVDELFLPLVAHYMDRGEPSRSH